MYEVRLASSNIESPTCGSMRFHIVQDDNTCAEVEYSWDDTKFSATFHGTAAKMPTPMHPVEFIARPIEKLLSLKTDDHKKPTDVFADHQVFISK